MSAAEILEIVMLLREESQRSFEYWLTISFACIAASFIGRRILTRRVAFAFGALYLLTVFLPISRYAVSGTTAERYLALAIEQGAEPFVDSEFVAYLRMLVFLCGTGCALWFIYRNAEAEDSDS